MHLCSTLLAISICAIAGCRKAPGTDGSGGADIPHDGAKRSTPAQTAGRPSTRDKLSPERLRQQVEDLRIEGAAGRLKGKELVSALSALARTDPDEALRLFSEPLDPNRNENWIGFSEVAEIICRDNPELLVEWMNQKLPGMANRDYANLYLGQAFSRLGTFSPATAVDSLKAMKLSDADMRLAVTAVFGGMATGDPALAEQKLAELDPKYRQKALRSLAETLGMESPLEGLRLAARIEDPTVRNSAGSEIYAKWIEADPEAAGSGFKALDPLQRQKLLEGDASSSGSLMGKLAEKDTELLLDLLQEAYPSALNRRVFETSLALTIDKNPARTLETIRELPAGNLKNQLAEDAYSKLARTHLGKALETLSQTSDPTLRAQWPEGGCFKLGRRGA